MARHLTRRVARNVILGALGLLVFSSGGPGAPQADTIVIDIQHSAFQPARLDVEAGSVVTFVLRNDDPIDHEFILGDEWTQRLHEEGTEAQHGVKPGEVSVPAGEERRTTYRFTESGQLIYGCHLPGHYDYGMRGMVRVTG